MKDYNFTNYSRGKIIKSELLLIDCYIYICLAVEPCCLASVRRWYNGIATTDTMTCGNRDCSTT